MDLTWGNVLYSIVLFCRGIVEYSFVVYGEVM